jgi:hypothetical protein
LSTSRERTLGGRGEATPHSWAKRQKLVKNEIQNIREIDRSYFVPLTIWHVLIRKRKQFENAETCLEKLVKSLLVNLFLAVFSHWESSVRRCAKREHEVNKLLETIISIGFGSKMSTNVKRVGKH